jgi:hypothetical protein
VSLRYGKQAEAVVHALYAAVKSLEHELIQLREQKGGEPR